MRTEHNHKRGLEELLKNPSRMGVTRRGLIIAKEPRFMDGHYIKAEPDFMLIQDGVCTLVEYKCSHSQKNLEKATEQLNRAEAYLRYHGFKYDDVRKLYVPGDSNPQMIGGN